ncbi:hypothetical protein ON010_g18482 [Phytophthora cinnamomi]|nr:hypothetical protein ON010_g18482 [Phytophthora cinnamomi]
MSISNHELRGTSISDDDYKRVQFVWEHYGMTTIKDLLIWYNNLDVVAFIKAIKAQRELFKGFDLDMFTDGVSLPGLSEKVMHQTYFNNLQHPSKKPSKAFSFPAKRMSGYKSQDATAKREFGMTLEHLDTLLNQQKYLCALCYIPLTSDTASADRINNKLGHINGNVLISCVSCNTARKNMSFKGFRYKQMLEFNSDRLVFSIDREEKGIYAKMKANIAGGPSVISTDMLSETKRRFEAVICKKIIGYDANALHLWALGNEMSCGRLTTIEAYDGIIDDIKSDKIFGFLECDIRTAEHLKQYFSEMTPIFKNILIDCTSESIIGKHMYEYNESRKQSRAKPARKLIGSYFGQLPQALELFMEAVSKARREGDADKSKAMIAEMMKLVGNSASGRSGMDMNKLKVVKYESNDKAIKNNIEHFTFHGLEELNDACEITVFPPKSEPPSIDMI